MIKTRFAPSPTGYLHIGSVRTALFSYLYAKKLQGKFVLRIEDTDFERSTTESIDAILEGMDWIELNYDEGPFYQSKRLDRYKQVADNLLQSGHAYYCQCSKERLEQLRTEQLNNKLKPAYDNHCRELELKKQPGFVLRFKNPLEGTVLVKDLIHGDTVFQNAELDDIVLVRGDDIPTYNFSVVVDDWDMGITHVIRGDDHLNNTPRQMNILQALNAPIPEYAHMPMILGPDGKRFSKRHGAVNVLNFKEEGILPEALINYLARLGWSYKDQEIFSKEELISLFDIRNVHKSAAAFDMDKLKWINHHYIMQASVDKLKPLLIEQYKNLNIPFESNNTILNELIENYKERAKTLKEMALQTECYFVDDIKYTEQNNIINENSINMLSKILEKIKVLDEWSVANIDTLIKDVAKENQIKLGQFGPSLRYAITGSNASPGLGITVFMLGKNRVINRLDKFINDIDKIS